VPVGLGSHVQWDRRLDGRIAQAMLSINAVKGVEIGPAFENAGLPGSQVHDVFVPWGETESAGDQPSPGGRWDRRSNRAGGMEGGMTNGQPLVVRCALKPISTLNKPLPSVDLLTGETVQAHYERSDICVVPAAGVIGEAMLAVVLAEAVLEKFGGDHLDETVRNLRSYESARLEASR
jgi:chorismate synthase